MSLANAATERAELLSRGEVVLPEHQPARVLGISHRALIYKLRRYR